MMPGVTRFCLFAEKKLQKALSATSMKPQGKSISKFGMFAKIYLTALKNV